MRTSHSKSVTFCCALDQQPRLYVEVVLWLICTKRYAAKAGDQIKVYTFGDLPADLIEWIRTQGAAIIPSAPIVDGSPHCNKIGPFFDQHESDWVIVSDCDLYFVSDVSVFLKALRFRAGPNNHCNPPSRIFKSILSRTGVGEYRPGSSLFPGAGNERETHINNISAGIVAAPSGRALSLALTWRRWANWLIENRDLLERWYVHVDQVGFALAMEQLGEDVEFFPPQLNMTLYSMKELLNPVAFHLTTGHIPSFPQSFDENRNLTTDGLHPSMMDAVRNLNASIEEAKAVIRQLDSVAPHYDKFLNPHWRR